MTNDTVGIDTPATPRRSRRALIMAALGGLGGLVASRFGAPGPAVAAAGNPLIMGNTGNTAGTANTSLTTASTGTALLVTQNGSGTALRGSAVGAGSIAGFFTAANGTGISGVTANPNTYGVFGSNDGATGGGGAIRASGKNNHGLVATTAGAGANAVRGTTSSSAANAAAIYGEVSSTGPGSGSAAVRGVSKSTSADGIGVWGSQAGAGTGVYGSSATTGYGVYGDSSGTGVFGYSSGSVGVHGSGALKGVFGVSVSGTGVHGYSESGFGVWAGSESNYGVYGYSTSDYAGYFNGALYAITASASIKSFRIDHPQDPAGKVLVHSCVESNERKLVYDGVVTTDARGEATVELPGYFEALNGDVRYQLTVIGSFAQAVVKREVAGNRFTIATSEPATKVSWQVTGVRQDAYSKAHPLVVESVKTGREKGRYLNPVEHGQPERLGVDYELRQEMRTEARTPSA